MAADKGLQANSHLCIASHGEIQEWFAVHCVPNHERRIAQHFSVRQLDHFLPLFNVVRRRPDGSQATFQAPLFPTYIFVRIARVRRVPVLEVPGVLSIVGNGRHPCSIPDSDIDVLRLGAVAGNIQPHPYLNVGARVRVRSGVMAGAEGVLVRNKGGCRVVITIEAVMKSVALEIDIADLEPAPPCCRSQVIGTSFEFYGE